MKPTRKQRKQATTQPQPVAAPQMVEICRSFSYKLNIPGAYESRDFFCSWKGQGTPEQVEDISRSAYEFCESEVLKSVRAYRAKMKAQRVDAA